MNLSTFTQIIRHIRNNKLTSFINVFGLGIGLGCVILMGTYVLHEFSFDKYHKNNKNLYRIVVDNNASESYAMGEVFKDNIPGIKSIFRIYDIWNTQVKLNNAFVKEDEFILADKEIFSSLNIPLLLGKNDNLLQTTTSLVISDKISNKYFPGENPVGKTLEVSISGRVVSFTITGVFHHFPSYSSLQANWIGNIEAALPVMAITADPFGIAENKDKNQLKQDWEKGGFQTIALVTKNTNIELAEKLCATIYKEHREKDYKVQFQPFSQIYLHSNNIVNAGPFKTSQLSTLKIYAGIALLILVVALINYILLSLADAKKQLKQVACYKINGASAANIQKRYLQQSLITSFLSLIPAMLFLALIIPFFNQLFDKNLSILLFLKAPYLAMLFAFIVFTGFVSGAYISFYSASINPLQLLSPAKAKVKGRAGQKGLLIAAQFIIFIFLCSSTLLMEKQLLFSTNKSPGFDEKNVLIFKLDNKEAQRQFPVIKSKIAQNPHVEILAGSMNTPPTQSFLQLTVENDDNDKLQEEGLFIGPNLIKTLKIPILEGEDYKDNDNSSETNNLIINETAAKKYKVNAGEYLGKFYIQAVVADFHAHSLHRFIKPLLLIDAGNENCTELVVRTDGNNKEVIQYVQNLWDEMLPTSFMEYESLSNRISLFYTKERKQTQSVMFFAFMAIVLAALGLFGYVSLTLIQRTKEIGIRKVNGAKVSEILSMINKDFVKWIVIAFLIATPIAYYTMNKWLENFAYKTTLSWWIFALAGLLALGIALLTVSWQSWRAATRNPVEALRYE
ncbi:MAG: FtsX-like permease family protein [Draconibacterium sp.]